MAQNQIDYIEAVIKPMDLSAGVVMSKTIEEIRAPKPKLFMTRWSRCRVEQVKNGVATIQR